MDNVFDSVGPPFVSPRSGDARGLDAPVDPSDLSEVVEALAVRLYVVQDVWPEWFFQSHDLPEFKNLSEWLKKAVFAEAKVLGVSPAVAAASLVRMDHPFDACKLIEDYYVSQGFSRKGSPVDGSIPFVEGIRSTAAAHAHISSALDKAFDVKYEFEQPRPVARVKSVAGIGEIDDDVLQSYSHPRHWSDPAGHGAFFGATAGYMELVWDVPEEVKAATRRSCLVAAHFRTFAFMHTASENDRGFWLGYKSVVGCS